MKYFLAISLSLFSSTYVQAADVSSIKSQPGVSTQRCGRQGYIENLTNGVVVSVSSQKCRCGRQGYVELLLSSNPNIVTAVTNIKCK